MTTNRFSRVKVGQVLQHNVPIMNGKFDRLDHLFPLHHATSWRVVRLTKSIQSKSTIMWEVSKVLDTNTRAKGKSLSQLFTAVASTVITYASSPVFGALKYYLYAIVIEWDIMDLVVIYFFWPDTKGRTLEELEEVFSAPNPVKKSSEPKTSQTVMNAIQAGKKDVEMTENTNDV